MPVTNNVTRLLDSRKIVYTAFELPAEKLGALEAARLMGVPASVVFKTIVALRGSPGGKPILAVIPGDSQLDVKALAAVLGEKKVRVPSQREAEQITGLQAGGISALALLNKGFQVFLDQSAVAHELIHVSAGMRGLNVRLPVKDLVKLANARLAAISSPLSGSEDPDSQA